jgi:DNA-directed RNA polymerase specialized sigma24 family protein
MTAREAQQEAAVYLSRYRVAKAEVRDIERRIERVRNEMMGVKGIDYTGGDMPKQQNRTGDLSDYVARIDDLLQDWKAAQLRAIETMHEISSAINEVDHDQARRVLMLHFVDGYEYERIAEMVPCDLSTVYRWRRIGLRKCAKLPVNAIKCQK